MADHLPAGSRPILSRVFTALAVLLLLFALLMPNDLDGLTAGAFVRIPVEALFAVAIVLALPGRARRVVAAVFGVGLGLLVLIKVLDMVFYTTLERQFDPVYDWSFFASGMEFLNGAMGHAGAIAIAVGLAIGALVLLALTTLAALRVTRHMVGHRTASTRVVTALGVIWIVCDLLGVELAPGQPVASQSAAALAYADLRQVRTDLQDTQPFSEMAAVDAYRNTPGAFLLNGLRGKDVVLTFVESYGRIAVEDPQYAPEIDPLLDAGTAQLRAAGFNAKSAFLNSSTFGGGSWLAHSTVESGLWINNQQRYNDLLASNRMTLSQAFQRAGWDAVWDVPAHQDPWPEGKKYYGFDRYYDAHNVGYHGPGFAYATMPDQYTFANFQRAERAKPDRKPIFAEIDTVSSHAPWSPRPWLVDWNSVGDGSVFDPMPAAGKSPESIWGNPAEVRDAYRDATKYALDSLISYVQTYGDDNLVLIFLGDHQPPVVTPANATHDVPITIVAKDPKVLDRISSWGWTDGLKPAPQAPVWKMDSFRDRFLKAFSSVGAR